MNEYRAESRLYCENDWSHGLWQLYFLVESDAAVNEQYKVWYPRPLNPWLAIAEPLTNETIELLFIIIRYYDNKYKGVLKIEGFI